MSIGFGDRATSQASCQKLGPYKSSSASTWVSGRVRLLFLYHMSACDKGIFNKARNRPRVQIIGFHRRFLGFDGQNVGGT